MCVGVCGMVMVVAMIGRSMGVSMSAQDEESDNIREQAQGANDKDELRVQDFWRIQESGDSFEDDGEAQCDQEDGIEEGAENLCS